MNRILLIILALIAPLSATAQFAAEVSAPFTNRYTFRGTELATESFQPSVELSLGNLTASVWSNQPVSKAEDPEVDFGVAYTIEREAFTVDLGLLAYHYPNLDTADGADRTTYEPSVTLSKEVGLLTLSATVFYDWTLKTATYQVGASAETNLTERLSLTNRIAGGLVRPRGIGAAPYAYWEGGAELGYRPSKALTVFAGGAYTSSDLTDVKRDIWTYTIGLRAAF